MKTGSFRGGGNRDFSEKIGGFVEKWEVSGISGQKLGFFWKNGGFPGFVVENRGFSKNGVSVGFWSRNRGKVGKSREFDDFWKIGKNREK